MYIYSHENKARAIRTPNRGFVVRWSLFSFFNRLNLMSPWRVLRFMKLPSCRRSIFWCDVEALTAVVLRVFCRLT